MRYWRHLPTLSPRCPYGLTGAGWLACPLVTSAAAHEPSNHYPLCLVTHALWKPASWLRLELEPAGLAAQTAIVTATVLAVGLPVSVMRSLSRPACRAFTGSSRAIVCFPALSCFVQPASFFTFAVVRVRWSRVALESVTVKVMVGCLALRWTVLRPRMVRAAAALLLELGRPGRREPTA